MRSSVAERQIRGRKRRPLGSGASSRPAPPTSWSGLDRACAAVINATGVVVHTNLGRAPLAREALDAAVERGARGYSNLEYDLDARRARQPPRARRGADLPS